MASSFFRAYPPYMGKEPYVYLCFHKANAKQVKPLLDALVQRRYRVWYSMGNVSESQENQEHADRVKNADLMVFWLSERAADDADMKGTLGYYLITGHPVICIDAQAYTAQSGLSLILTEHVKHISCEPGATAEDIVSSLLRMEGFTQQLIAEDDLERQIFLRKLKLRRIALTILSAALLLFACAIVYAQCNDWFRPQAVIVDSVTINDPAIERAARTALSPESNIALTPESLARITMLRLDAAPTSFDALALFPSLTRLEIPQSCVKQASALLDDAHFIIVVYSEEGA